MRLNVVSKVRWHLLMANNLRAVTARWVCSLGAMVLIVTASPLYALDTGPPTNSNSTAEPASCAAYFFNAARIKPMSEYNTLYRAGEIALAEVASQRGMEQASKLMSEAAMEVTHLTGSDWRNFGRAESVYGEACAGFLEQASVSLKNAR